MGVVAREKPKGSGVWWIFISHQGKRKSKKIGKDKRMAFEAAKKIEAKLALTDFGILKDEQIKTFGDYAQMWITTTIPATCKASTEKDYQGILKNHILPTFDKIPITEINRLMIKNFLMEKSNSGLSSSKVKHIQVIVAGVLNLAVDDEVVLANPGHRLGRMAKKRDIKKDINPLTKEELSLLLRILQKHYPKHYPMALTLARTGMRIGEVIGLQWGDIDFNGKFINVQRAITRGKVDTPKSGKGRRVDMSEQLSEALLKLKYQRKIETLEKGWSQLPEWIFQ